MLVLDFIRSFLRNENSVIHVDGENDRTGPAASQDFLRIVERGAHADRPGRDVDDAAYVRHLARLVVGRTVGQLQADSGDSGQGSLHAIGAFRVFEELLFGH